MEARSEPLIAIIKPCSFHLDLQIPGGKRILQAIKDESHTAHQKAVAWYRAEQARILARVFVTRFGAGFQKVFMGMPFDWDHSLAAFSTPNPYIGLLDRHGNPWPAFYTLKLLVEKLDGFQRVEKIIRQDNIKLFRFVFNNGRPIVWVAWLAEKTVRDLGDPIPRLKVCISQIKKTVTVWKIPTADQAIDKTTHIANDGLWIELDTTPILIQE